MGCDGEVLFVWRLFVSPLCVIFWSDGAVGIVAGIVFAVLVWFAITERNGGIGGACGEREERCGSGGDDSRA